MNPNVAGDLWASVIESSLCSPPLNGSWHHDQPSNQVSAFDCDILRSAFIKSVIEDNVPEDRWRALAVDFIRDLTGSDDVDPDLLEWIVRK